MIFPLLYIYFVLHTNYITYINPEKDYSIQMNNTAHYVRKLTPGGYSDMFSIKDKACNYSLIITKTVDKESTDIKTVLTDEYKKGFLSSCNCEVSGVSKLSTEFVNGVVFGIKMKSTQKSLVGFSYHIPKNNIMYTITFLTTEQNLKLSEKEYAYSVNTIKILK